MSDKKRFYVVSAGITFDAVCETTLETLLEELQGDAVVKSESYESLEEATKVAERLQDNMWV